MNKVFARNIIFLIAVNLIVKPLWIFGIDRNVQNFVGHIDYGQYQALFNFTIIFQIFLDFGLQNFNNREVAMKPKAMAELFPNILWAKLFLSIAYFILLYIFGFLLGFRGYNLILLGLLGLVQSLNSLLLFLRSNVSGQHEFVTDSILSILDKTLMILICGYLLFFSPWKSLFKIEWFVYAQIAAYAISSVVAFFICLRLGPIHWHKFRLNAVLLVAKKSLPYAVLIFAMAIYLRSDSVIMKVILPDGDEQAGIFAASFRLLDVANNMTGVLFAGILLPMFGRLLAKNESFMPLAKQSLNLLFPVALTTVVLTLFWGNEIMHALYTEANAQSGLILFVLLLSFPGFCIGYVYATLLTANGNLMSLIYVSLIAIAINLGLNFALIPKMGPLGAAIACSATQVVLSFLNTYLARKILFLKIAWGWIGQFLIFGILILGLGLLIKETPLPLLVQIGLLALAGLLGMFVCGLISIQNIKEIIRRENISRP